MKKHRYSVLLGLAALSGLLAPALSRADDSSETALKNLAVNRSLLTQCQLEYLKLQEEDNAYPSENRQRLLNNQKYKIKALHEDSEKLRAVLAKKQQAEEFIKDLLIKNSLDQYSKKYETPQTARPLSSFKPLTPSITEMHERALKYVAEQKLEKAIQLYEEIILDNPNDDQAYVIMGHCYLLSAEYEKAESAFQNAVHIDPENMSEITPFYENIILQNPDDDKAYNNLGYAYLVVGNYGKAEESFKNAIELNPQNHAAENGLQILQKLRTA